MTVPTAQPHIQAVLDLLTAALPAGVPVYHARVTDDPPPQAYVILYPDPGATSASALDAVTTDISLTVQATCVGISPRQCLDLADLVRSTLVDQRPTVSGRLCWQITQDIAGPPIRRDDVSRDPTLDQPRFYLTPIFRLASVPA